MQALSSPDPNVAEKAVVLVQTATTKIKEAITKSVVAGETPEELTKTLNKIIGEHCKEITNVELREDTRQALVKSARKWHYQINETVKILNRNMAGKLKGFTADTFTADVRSMLKDIDKLRINSIRGHLDKSSKGLAVIEDYDKKLKLALRALAAEPPKVIKTKAGAVYTMSLRNRAEMAVRYHANLIDLQGFIDAGVEYVWTTSHPDASPRCAPHQGKLYSLNPDNKKGVHNGIPYTYLFDVLKLHEGNSIINGYNCRHRLVAYQEGSSAPTEYSLEEIKKEYAIDQMQRRYENNIRQLKSEERLLREAGYTAEASIMRKKWRRLTKEYEIFSLENERAFYRWRTIIDRNEAEYKATFELQKEPGKDIIKAPISFAEKLSAIDDLDELRDVAFAQIKQNGIITEIEYNMIKSKIDIDFARANFVQLEKLTAEYNTDMVGLKFGYSPPGTAGICARHVPDNHSIVSVSIGAKARPNSGQGALTTIVEEENRNISVITHEFAHTLSSNKYANLIKRNIEINATYHVDHKSFWNEIKAVRRRYAAALMTHDGTYTENYISAYANTNLDEFLAEAFAMAKLSSKPSPYAEQVLEIVDKYFKKVKKE